MQVKSEKEKDLLQKNKTRATIFLIGILLISVVLFLISIPMGIRLGEYDPEETIYQFAGVDAVLVAVYALLNLVCSVIGIVFIVFFFNWLYSAYAHLQEQHVTGLAHTPRWAIGWYFIPVMNLYKPFSVMRELTLASFHAVSNPDYLKLKKVLDLIIYGLLVVLVGCLIYFF